MLAPIRAAYRARARIRVALRILSANRITEESLMAAIDTLNQANTLLEAMSAQIDAAIANAEASDSPAIVTAAGLALTNAQAVATKLEALAPVVVTEPSGTEPVAQSDGGPAVNQDT